MISIRRIPFKTRAILLVGALALTGTLPANHGAVQAADSGTLRIGWPNSPVSFDPPVAPDNPSIWVLVNIYDPLLRPGNDGTSLKPDLASSWDITSNGTVYTFHLRPNIYFHDGSKMTSADVKFSLDRARKPANLWGYLFTAIKNISTPDANTVRITLLHPWSPFLSDMAFFAGGIYPQAYFKKVGAKGLAAHPIGTGPYALQSFQPGTTTILVKNARYWGASQYPMQRVEFDVISNDSSRLLQVQSGQLDVDNVLAPNLVGAVRGSQTAHVLLSNSTIIKHLDPNHKVKPLGDLKVRQAINHAIDRQAIIKTVYLGFASPANSFMPKGMIDYDPNLPVPTHDLALAKKLMSESTVPHGFSMTMEIRAGNVEDQQTAVLFKQQVAQIGINVTIKPVDSTTLNNDSFAEKFDFFPQYWTNDIPDPDELVSYSVDPAIANDYYTQFHDMSLAQLSRTAEVTSDQAKRKQLYFQIQEKFAQELPFFYTVYVPFVNAVNNHVHNFGQNPLGYFILQGVTKS